MYNVKITILCSKHGVTFIRDIIPQRAKKSLDCTLAHINPKCKLLLLIVYLAYEMPSLGDNYSKIK